MNNTTTSTTRSKYDALCAMQKNEMKRLHSLRHDSLFTHSDPIQAMQINALNESINEITDIIRQMWKADPSLLNDHSMTADQALRQCIASRNFK